MFLNFIKDKNLFPIVFIGSGITLRYYKNAPTWNKLLERLWKVTHPEDDYYGAFELLKMDNNLDSFQANILMAERLEQDYKRAFFSGKIKLSNLTTRVASEKNISPFKQAIANIFSDLELNDDMEDELRAFREMLTKARMIITTNYDPMIENLLNNNIHTNIGSESLFYPSEDMNELFKIHGSISNPNSIVITEEDYKNNEKTSTLINAKILSNLIDSPIIFLGYSLTDENVRSLLRDFSDNLPKKLHQNPDRIAVVTYDQGNMNIKQENSEISDLNIHYTSIKTDNYIEVYNNISKINQGLTPNEIAKYSSAFKKIIQTKGQEGTLDTVLTSFIDLSDLPNALKSSKLVVAFGDSRHIYKTPDYSDYISAYFNDVADFPVEIALNYIRQFSPKSTLPITKFIKRANNGFDKSAVKKLPNLIDKIIQRNQRFSTLEILQSDLPIGKEIEATISNQNFDTPQKILDSGSIETNPRNRIYYITKNIKKFNKSDLLLTINLLLETLPPKIIEKTEYRKFFFACSLYFDDELVNLEI